MNLRHLIAVLPCIFVCMVGCGPGTGKVSGVVTVGGKPVPAGLVTFRPQDPAANSVSVELDREGKFKVELPVGPCRIAIDNRQYQPLPKPGAGIPSGISLPPEVMAKLKQTPAAEPETEVDPTKTADAPVARDPALYMPVPEKYFMVETSGLTIDVEPGEQSKNLEL